MSGAIDLSKGTKQYYKKSKKLTFGRNIGKPLPNKTFHFALTNDGKKYELLIDGVLVAPKMLDDFTIEGWHYSNEYINRTKLQRIWAILKEENL